MYRAGDMIVLGARKYLFVWDPILCRLKNPVRLMIVEGANSELKIRNLPCMPSKIVD
eukprot:COSAG02_NODE_61742_length_267_cov_2.220238_1_plen_56_part_01